jgi:hypothetical protein
MRYEAMTAILSVVLPFVMLAAIFGGIFVAIIAVAAFQETEGVIVAGFGFLMLTLFHCTEMILKELRKP